MSNVIAGFRITGIFSFDRHALRPSEGKVKPKPKSLAERTGLKYVPLFSPAPTKRQSQAVTPSFSETEMAQFEIRFEEGYDLDIDPRYTLWKKMYHPDNSLVISLSTASSLNRQLSLSSPSPLCPLPGELNLSEELSDEETEEENEVGFLCRPTVLSKFLSHPAPQLKLLSIKPKSSARVLTSSENLQMIEAEEREKREKQELKEKRKRKEKRRSY